MKIPAVYWIILLFATLPLAITACSGSNNDSSVRMPPAGQSVVYDPNAPDANGRLAAPTTNDPTPDQINGSGNSGITMPVAGVAGSGHR